MRFQSSGGAWRSGNVPAVLRYLLGISTFLAALATRFMLVDILPSRGFPFLSFFPAVLLTVYFVGLGPGLLVAVLSTFSAWAFFMGPSQMSFALAHGDIIALVVFSSILIIDCLVIERMNVALKQLRVIGDKLRLSEATLLEQQDQLRKIDRQKDVFIATLAHELRNPLAPILASAQLISLKASMSDHVAQASAIIIRQSLQMTRLVDDLLDVSRIQSAKLTLQMTFFDLRTAIASALETMQPVIDRSANAFHLDLPKRPVWINGDSARLSQCVANVLHNAFKFTPGAGTVRLRMDLSTSNTVVITVTDTGHGIAREMLPQLFEMFTQAEVSGSNGNNGLGIGLALTKYLVGCHHGTVAVHSDGLGLGARISITLPTTVETNLSIPAQTLESITRHVVRVLVVDDNIDAAVTIQSLLRMSGFEVGVAHSGADALDMLSKTNWDAVLLDIGLPDMSGYDVATSSRAQGLLGTDTLLVALTGWSDAESRRKSAEAGITRHLNKPVQLDVLLKVLKTKSAE